MANIDKYSHLLQESFNSRFGITRSIGGNLAGIDEASSSSNEKSERAARPGEVARPFVAGAIFG